MRDLKNFNYQNANGHSARRIFLRAATMGVSLVIGAAVVCQLQAGDESLQSRNANSLVRLFSKDGHGWAVDYSKIPTVQSKKFSEEKASLAKSNHRPGRVAFLGDTLIHRATEFGYIEAELTRLAPSTNIVFRNLGWPGDTVAGTARVEFGSSERDFSSWRRPSSEIGDYGFRKMMSHVLDAWPHVLFVAYGSNVAFDKASGIDRFGSGLNNLLDTLQPTGVQIVLMSPPPREIRGGLSGNLADQNRRLAEVAKLLRKVASQRKLDFVDLFHEWPHDKSGPRFTDNGIHLNAHGYRTMATLMAQLLFPADQPYRLQLGADGAVGNTQGAEVSSWERTEFGFRWQVRDRRLPSVADSADTSLPGKHANGRVTQIGGLSSGVYTLDIDGQRVARAKAEDWARGVIVRTGPDFDQLETLRRIVLKKNHLHFYGSRPQNKAYIQLFRRHERGNHESELEKFALLITDAEDDIARLRVPKARVFDLMREADYFDHEVPGESPRTTIAEELASLSVPEGFEISLFASDPMIGKPININWDEHGRMWVATSTTYPHLRPGQTPNDRIIVLEDIDRDGRADKSTVFADGLLVPHSVIPGLGGAFVTQSTDLLFLQDTDGDGKADQRRVVLSGFGNADVHHMIHGLRWGPGGDLYFNQSIYINSVIETPWGIRTSNGSCTWRLRPETFRLETFTQGMVNPWGHAFGRWGQSFATDGAGGGGLTYLFPGGAFVTYPYAGRALPSMNPGRPKECGLEQISGRHFPAEWQGTFLTSDFRANHVTRYRLSESGSGYRSEFLGEVVSSRLRSFRPVDVKMGPDGAIYIVDWYNYIIDHGEVDFHHPLRDKQRGRIWRLTVKNSPLQKLPHLADANVRKLLVALQSQERWTRDQSRRLLRERGSAVVLPTLKQWLSEEYDSLSEHDRLEILWVYQGLRVVEANLLRQLLKSKDHHVRSAAVRVLSDWRGRIPDTHQRLAEAVMDEHAQVRLEAVNTLRRIGTKEAVALAMSVLDRAVDRNLDFALFRTAHELRDVWLPRFLAGEQLFGDQPQRIAFALLSVSDAKSVGPLANLVQKDQVPGSSLVDALVVLAQYGQAAEHKLTLDRLPKLNAAATVRVLTALAQSDRGTAPANVDHLVSLVDSADSRVRQRATELAGRWQLKSAAAAVIRRARDPRATSADRLDAAHAITAIETQNSKRILMTIYDEAETDEVRATTIAAMVVRSSDVAARLAVRRLAVIDDLNEAALLIEAFLKVKFAHRQLTRALEDSQFSSKVAEKLVDTVRLSGRDLPQLITAIQTAGSLKPRIWKMTGDEIGGLLRDVSMNGNINRGKLVFQRKKLQCVTCHAIRAKGGKVGPDLTSLGGSARLGDILKSLLEPSAGIKQGYQTTTILSVDGRVFTGIVQQKTDLFLRLRDANDRIVTIPTGDVEEMLAGKVSIMPTGLMDSLSRDELVDLLRYLSSLGRAK